MRILLLLPVSTYFLVYLSGCGYMRIDPMHPYLRSPIVDTAEKESAILSRAHLEWSADGRVRVLIVRGTPYERGYQQGVLLRKEIQDNLGYLMRQARKTFRSEELFAEAYERLRPFIPQDYIDEMHGLAHGAKVPLSLIHYVHALPSITEWGGKKALKATIKKMMDGELATSCSNLSVSGNATPDGDMYSVRILDWGIHKISKLHDYPLITVNIPDHGVPSANIGWVGFLGAVSGINADGITLGEMGYGAPPNETLAGLPMPFLLREVLTNSRRLADARDIIREAPGTNSFIFLISSGQEQAAELYVKDRDRFLIFGPNQDLRDNDEDLPAIPDTVYGGHFGERMFEELSSKHGTVTPELLMDSIIPEIAMKSNFQNVVYFPSELKFWVSNAASSTEPAYAQPYTEFDLKELLIREGAFPVAGAMQ